MLDTNPFATDVAPDGTEKPLAVNADPTVWKV
jgi:hypothetical protein